MQQIKFKMTELDDLSCINVHNIIHVKVTVQIQHGEFFSPNKRDSQNTFKFNYYLNESNVHIFPVSGER